MSPPIIEKPTDPDAIWSIRRDRLLVVLECVVLTGIGIWVASFFIRALVLFGIAALLAYALYPIVQFLSRFLPRPIALILVYVLLLGSVGAVVYLVVITAISQVSSLISQISGLLSVGPNNTPPLLVQFLEQLGLTANQINSLESQIMSQFQGLAQSVIPFVEGVLNSLLDLILVLVVSVYLLIDGPHVTAWLTTETPLVMRSRMRSMVVILQMVVGGYIRGQLIMSSLIGVLVGGGMALFQVPDAILLGVLAFLLEFIPTFGTLISGVVCVLLAFTQGWLIALFVLIYFIVVHILEGDIVGPRVLGKAIGVHPVVSLLALIAGGELFGLIGAVFASLAAGLIQALVRSFYREWRVTHPRQFPAPATVPTSTETPEDPENPDPLLAPKIPM